MLTFSGVFEPTILGEYAGLDTDGVVGPEDSATSEARSRSLVSPGGRVGIGVSSGTACGRGGVGGRRPKEGRSMSTAW